MLLQVYVSRVTTMCLRKSGAQKLLTNMVLHSKAFETKFPCLRNYMPHCLPIGSKQPGMIFIN